MRVGKLYMIAVLSFTILACVPEFETLEMEQLSTPPVAGSVNSDGIELTSGTGVIVLVNPVSANSESYDSADNVELESSDSNIMRIYRGDQFREFGVVGCGPGKANMRIIINGSFERSIEVKIL